MKRLNNTIKIYLGIISLSLTTYACAPEIDSFESSAGSDVDFTKYIAVGNSLTAGFADRGLYLEGQQVAFPNLIAEQLKNVGGGTFNTPFFSEEQRNGSGYLQLKSLTDGQPVMEQVTSNLAYREAGKLTKYTGKIHNYGVPGMRVDLAYIPQFGALNMYFERLLPEAEVGTKSYFDFVTTRSHTFFSFWLGNNDVLGYAMNGAYENPEDATTTFTSVTNFTNGYGNFINTLTTNGQKGVVATIPDVSTIPFFTTVTTARLQAGVEASTGGAFDEIYISTASGVRIATAEDLFTLSFPTDTLGKTSNGILAYGLIPQNPLHDRFVIDKDEVAEIAGRVNAFNTVIKQVAASKKLAIADAHAYLNKVKTTGISYNGINVNAAFIQGNAFSLDGIHLTPLGNALMANLFIDAINLQYNARIPKVDATKYRGVKYP
ncbi:G-D-S-L family lipolytic protein [Sphingobacterium alkalisoli]|uniref:G-D-S-L family lipolytic protein n=1 Tax=Sphingobacterium alkalisoli TaxID=1874115 RepID=A0A4V5LXZ2_9SPHI|nr:SGNH/GDSL hydrolase family protein [Sphingobacterium alkalisoli]TJY64409.1 G-D-S-L family lipolytic protein [Sphingobacterium alkalisoli]